MSSKVSYFAGGPAKLPQEVLEKVSADILSYGSTGVGILEVTHRSKAFLAHLDHTVALVREVLEVPDNYKILFMVGGGVGQFDAVPLNLIGKTGKADYIITGTWSKKAAEEAAKHGVVNKVAVNTQSIPDRSTWKLDPQASYLYYCDNETIQGIEFPFVPEPPAGVPLVCDMSSNICSRKIDFSKFGVIFACSQKNIGASGVTLVLVRDDLLGYPRSETCPTILDYSVMAKKNSNFNTPPVYAIHVLSETFSWCKRQGGVAAMEVLAQQKSGLLYNTVEASGGFYCSSVQPNSRSRMNVVFTIGSGDSRNTDLEAKFISEADKANLKATAGHRDVGGMRVSVYNAITLEDVARLVDFMNTFHKQNS